MPIACLAVAVVAIAAVRSTTEEDTAPVTLPRVGFPDSNGLSWLSLDKAGPVSLSGTGRFWLSFRAFSPEAPARLEFDFENGKRERVEIGRQPSVEFVGPLTLVQSVGGWMTPSRGEDRRALVFLSEYRLVQEPVAALPGPGFWGTELGAGGELFNWLNERATIDVRSERPLPEAWIAFDAESVDAARTLRLSSGGLDRDVELPALGDSVRVTFGPIDLSDGAAEVEVESDGAGLYGTDPRKRSVKITSLTASARRP